MKILVIEDEEKTANFLRKGLVENGYAADVAGTGEEGLRLAKAKDYDMILLDVLLPGLNGWQVLRNLRGSGVDTPVIFLTARDAVTDRVAGLELGADDYLVKPFEFSELLARIQTVLRRGPSRLPDMVRVGDMEIDFTSHKVTRGGERINLTPREYALLSLFVRKKGEVLTRARIAERVWDVELDADTNVIDVHVRRLRAKLDDPFEQKLIHTVRGVGYVLEER